MNSILNHMKHCGMNIMSRAIVACVHLRLGIDEKIALLKLDGIPNYKEAPNKISMF